MLLECFEIRFCNLHEGNPTITSCLLLLYKVLYSPFQLKDFNFFTILSFLDLHLY